MNSYIMKAKAVIKRALWNMSLYDLNKSGSLLQRER